MREMAAVEHRNADHQGTMADSAQECHDNGRLGHEHEKRLHRFMQIFNKLSKAQQPK